MTEVPGLLPGPYLAPHLLTSHQPPALLVAEVLAVAVGGVAGRARLCSEDGLDGLQLVEGCAQTLACLMGQAQRAVGGAVASGVLVGVHEVAVRRVVAPGEEIIVEAELAYTFARFRQYAVCVRAANGEVVLTADVQTMITASVP